MGEGGSAEPGRQSAVEQWGSSLHVYALICFALAVVAGVFGLVEHGRDRSEAFVWAAFMVALGLVALALWRLAAHRRHPEPAGDER